MAKNNTTKIIQGGFSEPILQPIYLVCIGTIFLLNPFIGFVLSTILVAVPAFSFAIYVSRRQDAKLQAVIQPFADKYNVYIDVHLLGWLLIFNDNKSFTKELTQVFHLSYFYAELLTQRLMETGYIESDKPLVKHHKKAGTSKDFAPKQLDLAKA